MREKLLQLLNALNYKGMLEHIYDVIESAEKDNSSWKEVICKLLEIEISYRKTRSLMYRLKVARLPQIKTIENFDIDASALEEKTLNSLLTCDYIKNAENLLLIGGTGTGKSHIALALAYVALHNNFKVRFFKFSELARKLINAQEHRYEANLMAHLQRFNLLVIDELGYMPIDEKAGPLLFELFSNCYEKVAIIITTHLGFNEWDGIFGNLKSTKVVIDRLTHHCKIIETGNTSWRLKQNTELNIQQKKINKSE